MAGNAEFILSKNIYCFAAVVVLASTLVGSASGTTHGTKSSCLSYGHSCWGAHGKRNGNGLIGALRPIDNNIAGIQSRRLPPLDGQWFISRINRHLMQMPLANKLHATRILDDDSSMMDGNVELRSDQKLIGDEPDSLLIPDQRDLAGYDNDEALKAAILKILRNMD